MNKYKYEEKINQMVDTKYFRVNQEDINVGLNNKITEDDIIKYEEKLGAKLPDEYKYFLLKYNGFAVINGIYGIKIRDEYQDEEKILNYEIISEFYSLYDLDKNVELFEEGIGYFFLSKTIPFAISDMGKMFVLSLREDEYNSIYFNWEKDCFTQDELDNGDAKIIASSFSDFISKIENLDNI